MRQVLFPLLSDLSPGSSDGGGGGALGADVLLDLEEQRVALITTLTRTFKKHIGIMAPLPDFHTLWLKLVGGTVLFYSTPASIQIRAHVHFHARASTTPTET